MPTNATRPTGPRSLATATSPDTPHALRGAPQLRTDPPCPLLSQVNSHSPLPVAMTNLPSPRACHPIMFARRVHPLSLVSFSIPFMLYILQSTNYKSCL
ncbi:hypothetical protein BD779DRAFT_1560497 [Infundibulicybe gibba]|nr:hypothetical protein BD779DRAFT_1565816 [Infundibulicybe gibba]KAF8876402.1 hypothetical protein BD779DRAFT_1560497 [Infundibulicybe gibba]